MCEAGGVSMPMRLGKDPGRPVSVQGCYFGFTSAARLIRRSFTTRLSRLNVAY